MPTENRSSNTEMVSVPRERLHQFIEYSASVCKSPAWVKDKAALLAALEQPAPQPHPDPIAWMVGTAFWWTKEEAERDAATTGMPIVGLGPMVATGPAEQQHREPVAWVRFRNGEPDYDGDAVMISNVRGDTLGDGDSWQPVYTQADPGEVELLRSTIEQQKNLIASLRAELVESRSIDASAEPSAPLPPVDGDLLPSVGSKVLIHLAREDEWVEHTVVGYYVWENLRPDPSVHRVCVRVRDADGYLNARGLGDIRPVALESES